MRETPGVRLRDRDYSILEHVKRHRITTREAVQRLFAPNHELNAATKILSRLVKADCLSAGRYLPDGQTKYWRLSPRYVNTHGLHPYNAKPLNFGPAIEHFGVLAFCCLNETRHTLLTSQEFRKLYPDHYDEHLLRSSYYLDSGNDGVERLGLIVVDSGQRDEARLVRRFRQLYKRRLELPGFRKRLRDPRRLFLITVLTPNAEKQEAIYRAIDEAARAHDKWPVAFRIEVEQRIEQMMVPYGS